MPTLPIDLQGLPRLTHIEHHKALHAFYNAYNNSGTTFDNLNTVINVKDYGAAGDGVTNDTAAVASALAAAGTGCVYFPQGTYLTTLSFTGLRCTMRGDGDSTVIKAPTGTTGPVIDMTGYLYADNVESSRGFSDFRVEHDGTAGAAKKGIYAPFLGALIFRNISIADTGGYCLDISKTQLSLFENITLNTPVSAKANDIAYLYGEGECNGNVFINVGFRSISASADTGVSGALVLVEDATNAPTQNVFYGMWFEYLHPPQNGKLVYVKGALNSFRDTQIWDTYPEVQTGTRIAVFAPTTVGFVGGNRWDGYLQGRSGSPAFEWAIELGQSGNSVIGHGHGGYLVTINTNVIRSTVTLLGVLSGSTDPRVGGNGVNLPSNYIAELGINSSQIKINQVYIANSGVTPDAPAFDAGVLFTQVTGGGKSQLCVRFPTGAIQVLATEP